MTSWPHVFRGETRKGVWVLVEVRVACIKVEQVSEYYPTPAAHKIVIDRVGADW